MVVSFNKYLNRMIIDGTLGDEITFGAAAQLFNIEFVIVFTLNRAAEATITPQNFENRVYLGHFVKNHVEHYVIFLMNLLILKLKKTTDKSILNRVENFDKSNESFFFEMEKTLINRSAICHLKNMTLSYSLYFQSFRNLYKFCLVVLDGYAVTKLLAQLYVSQDILTKLKIGEVLVKAKPVCFLDWLSISRKY